MRSPQPSAQNSLGAPGELSGNHPGVTGEPAAVSAAPDLSWPSEFDR